jgi:chromosome partitioning protein
MKLMAVFNMRGGIGKTTTVVSLAESMAFFRGLRVLVVDADPQMNASRRLCLPTQINACNRIRNEKNISKYILDYVTKNSTPNPLEYVTERVGTIHGAGQVDILLGSPTTQDADRHLAGKSMAGAVDLFSSVSEAFRHLGVNGTYDLIIVDCPPSFSPIVQGAVSSADLLLAPMTAQNTSRYHYEGTLDQIRKQLKATGFKMPDTQIITTLFESSQRTVFELISNIFNSQLRIGKHQSFADAELFSEEHGATIKEKYDKAERQLRDMAFGIALRLGLPMNIPAKPARIARPREVINVGKRRGDIGSSVAGDDRSDQRKASACQAIDRSH